MSPIYTAEVVGNKITWLGQSPPESENGIPFRVSVLLAQPPDLAQAERGRLVGEALRNLAAMDAFADIDDAVEWQREQRRDRPLPGRDD